MRGTFLVPMLLLVGCDRETQVDSDSLSELPVVAITSPLGGQHFGEGTAITFVGTISD
ncbi:MAG: hypothetical protein HN348_31330, partial [Proteobacteria bacterium]|nr:hypothetical protein [Pseudomonadota bacterium]